MSDKTAPYQYGEIVEIIIREATVRDFKRGFLYVDIPGNDLSTRLPLGEGKTGDASVRVLVIQPADGPAQPGDIWRTPAGARWFAYEELHYGKVTLFLTSGELRGHTLAEICESYGTPTLEYRAPAPAMNGTTCENEPAVLAEFVDGSGSTWLSRPDDMFALAGVPDVLGSGAWRTRAEVEADFGPLTAKGNVADPLAVASQQLRESTDGDEFAAAFGGFMTELGKAAEHEQGFHDDCDPATCGDAAQDRAEERAEQAAAVKA